MPTRCRRLACLAGVLLLGGCAMDPAPPERPRDPSFWCGPRAPVEVGRIWIYRTAPKGPGVPPDIVVDGRVYNALRPGTAYTVDVRPGRHQVGLAYDPDTIEVDLAAGGEAFVRFDKDPALLGRGFFPVRVAADEARREIHDHTGTDFSCVRD